VNALDRRTLETTRARVLQRMPQPAPESFIPHRPHPKQAEFLALDCLEALYGGAAGGGKTDAMLAAAAQYVHVPGYSALIIRRTFKELNKPNAIMDRARQWWDKPSLGIHWSAEEKRFTFPSGAVITFGYFDHERDADQYQSSEYQFIGVDEVTELPQLWYTFLFSRLRRVAGMPVPLRMRCAATPGGIGHEWVKERFIEGGERGAIFVPARARDNPTLDVDSYNESLSKLDDTRQRQLRDGEWIQDSGTLVYGKFSKDRNLSLRPDSGRWHYLCALDFGVVDQNAITVIGWRDHDTTIYVVESYRRTAIASVLADELKALEQAYRFECIVGDESGLGKAFAEEMRQRHGIPVTAALKNNKLGYIRLLNSDLANGRIKVDPRRCADLLDEWRKLPWNEGRTKECEGFDNHASDATLYGWRAGQAFWQEAAPPPPPAPFTPEWEKQRLQREIAKIEHVKAHGGVFCDELPPWLGGDAA
jgi:hypothetical protein